MAFFWQTNIQLGKYFFRYIDRMINLWIEQKNTETLTCYLLLIHNCRTFPEIHVKSLHIQILKAMTFFNKIGNWKTSFWNVIIAQYFISDCNARLFTICLLYYLTIWQSNRLLLGLTQLNVLSIHGKSNMVSSRDVGDDNITFDFI